MALANFSHTDLQKLTLISLLKKYVKAVDFLLKLRLLNSYQLGTIIKSTIKQAPTSSMREIY